MLTAAGSSPRFTTGNSCNVCHMCSHHQQGRKLLRGDLHLPQDSLFLMQERRDEWARLCPQTSDKRMWSEETGRLAVRAAAGLQDHAGLSSHSLPQPLGMLRILSPVKPHPACLSRGLLQEGPPSAIHRSMTDGPEKKG